MKRNAIAVWNGTGKEGHGYLTTESGVLKKQEYSYLSRFESGSGTNPEELIAAAHAGCFAMKLSFVLEAGGFKSEALEVTATVTLDEGAIVSSHLDLKAVVLGISEEKFSQCVEEAKMECPISKSLTAAITVSSTLSK